MPVTARDIVAKSIGEGKSKAQVLAEKPSKDNVADWAAND
jgi:hypothetical protein